MNDALHLLSGDVQLAGEHGPAADEDGIIVLPEFFKGDILADAGVEVNLHAQVLDHLDLRLQDVLGEAVFGDPHRHPAARHGQGFKDIHAISVRGQIVGGRQAGRTGADNGNLFIFFLLDFRDVAGLGVQVQIGHEALEVHDVDGLFDLAPHAGLLAGMVADPAADGREGVLLFDELEGFLVLARGDEGHIALDADVGGTGRLAGGGPEFVDGEAAGNGLGEMAVGGLALVQVLVEIRLDGHGAGIGAVAAARALVQIDKPGGPGQLDLESARLALHGLHRAAGHDLHVGMTPHFHKLRGEDAGRAVIGGKSLVELGHDAADADPVLHEVHFHTGICEVQGRLNTGDARPDDHYRADFLVIFQHLFTPVRIRFEI